MTNDIQSIAVAGRSAAVSLQGVHPLGSSGPAGRDSAAVTVSAATRLADLSKLVSSLVDMGVSATVRLRSGETEKLRSAIAALNERTEIVSAVVTLRGDRPIK